MPHLEHTPSYLSRQSAMFDESTGASRRSLVPIATRRRSATRSGLTPRTGSHAAGNDVVMDAPTDADLIRTSLREPRAFAGIFDRHFARVRGYLGRRVESEVAADLASEAFTIAFDARARFDLTRADAGPWLLGIATNLLRHHRRGEVRRLRALASLPRESGVDDGATATRCCSPGPTSPTARSPLPSVSPLAPCGRDCTAPEAGFVNASA